MIQTGTNDHKERVQKFIYIRFGIYGSSGVGGYTRTRP
jgi:hypothetical protein